MLIEYSTTDISQGKKVAYVEDFVVHDEYKNGEKNHDIGLVEVKIALKESSKNFKVNLPFRGDYKPTGTPAILVGKDFITSFPIIALFNLRLE